MKLTKTRIPGVVLIEPKVFEDSRGYFFESYNKRDFDKAIGYGVDFIQDNEACSSYGVVRGLHFQKGEFAQAKLIRVTEGKVLDVAVDLREESPTYGQYVSQILSNENKLQMFIPRGFAHGYAALSERVIFQYKCDNLYCPEAEGGLKFNDPKLGIDWRIKEEDMIISEKDKKYSCL
ncbi:dTDP-4-dehydrorhamnose 3,5-epimerase [Marinilabiliaceae bacterium JC040]|nr:dTDP-4-dehydrorhamnose 3,5-epimerase [Marinilabiliaceae bacterium JC040]